MTHVASTAKALREALKKAFPDVKFSVRSERYPIDSITITYAAGPHKDALNEVVQSLGVEAWKGIPLVTAKHKVTDKLTENYHWVDKSADSRPWV